MADRRARIVEVQILVALSLMLSGALTGSALNFTFSSFQAGQPLKVHGNASITSSGVVNLTKNGEPGQDNVGYLLYADPIPFKNPSGFVRSFSTSFTFQILTYDFTIGDGMAFMIVPANESLPVANSAGRLLGLMNRDPLVDPGSLWFAVEFDTYQNVELNDSSPSHIGIDINTVISSAWVNTTPPAHGDNPLYLYKNYTFTAWIDYDESVHRIEVRMAQQPEASLFPHVDKPGLALTYLPVDLSTVFVEDMQVGFSAATAAGYEENKLFNWEFPIESEDLVPSPSPSPKNAGPFRAHLALYIAVPPCVLLITAGGILLVVVWYRSARLPLLVDSIDSGPREYSYRELRNATRNFDNANYLAKGAYSSVYRGLMRGQTGIMSVAIKRMNDQNSNWERGFRREIEILSGLRHPNILKLQGWCRQKKGAFLVYDYMARGSLDQYLSREIIAQDNGRNEMEATMANPILTWEMRKHIMLGVATALEYLHTAHRLVLHRDVKAANVLLDEDWNACVGDFGFARLVNKKNADMLTHVGTPGYAAPEIEKGGQVTDRTDVYSFGILIMEVVCGRRVVVKFDENLPEQLNLQVWVDGLLKRSPWIRG